MRSIGMKAAAFVLAVVFALLVAASGFGVIFAAESGFYGRISLDDWKLEMSRWGLYELSHGIARDYVNHNLTELPEELLQNTGFNGDWEEWATEIGLGERWHFTLEDKNGAILYTGGGNARPSEKSQAIYTQALSVEYLIPDEENGIDYGIYYDGETWQEYILSAVSSDEYTVTIYYEAAARSEYNGMPTLLVDTIYAQRFPCIGLLIISGLGFLACAVYLCWAAGRKTGTEEICPAGLNRLPLDLYLAVTAFGLYVCAFFAMEILRNFEHYWSDFFFMLVLVLLLSGGVTLAMAALFAAAAQLKAPGFFWWTHSVTGRLLGWAWSLGKRILRFCVKKLSELFRLLPLIWQWVLILGAEGLFLLIFLSMGAAFLAFLMGLVGLATVAYCAWACGKLFQGMRRMALGDLNTKIDDSFLYGSFGDSAKDLNALGDVVITAAKKQLSSDRMKTELITNVSHDIKTPLTSIINYVDLLGNAQTEEQRREYLEVLGRQSQQMKRLLEDLLEMSKATTGNLSVELKTLDAAETVTQALGEYADRLEMTGLTPVFRTPEELIAIRADGRHTWRVLSNILNNVYKYALPGTRVYLELQKLDGWAVLSVKNISRDELNISAQELMERFVRGDASRNTEGSGLGLNIAQSLMQTQGGRMELQLDGDLFKVLLYFPCA